MTGRGFERVAGVRGHQVVEGRGVRRLGLGPCEHDRERAGETRLGHEPGERLVVDQDPRPFSGNHVRELRRGEAGVEEEGVCTQLGDRQRRLDETPVVATEDPHRITGLDAKARQTTGNGIGARLERGVVDGSPVVHDRDPVGMTRRTDLDARCGRGAPRSDRSAHHDQAIRTDGTDQTTLAADAKCRAHLGE